MPFTHEQEEYNQATELSKSFHGRDVEEEFEVEEATYSPDSLAVLGELVEIELESGCLLDFADSDVKLCAAPDGLQYVFVGEDQTLDDEALEELGISLPVGSKQLLLGDVASITYSTDKHHLDDSDGEVVQYQHEFGEEGGELPALVYDPVNERLSLVGGSYETKPEGITN
jgi:hypothetical protein